MLYHRDEQTGEHLVTHEGREQRFPTRAAAIDAARDLLERSARAETPESGS
jgi:hypothetical protein